MINIEDICFVGNANQTNYIDQFNKKIKSLNSDFQFPYYVCSNEPKNITSCYDRLKVFDLKSLQSRCPETIQYENLKDGVKLRYYPSNIRRHIIHQAFQDGFKYVVWNDCDVRLHVSSSYFLKHLSSFEINNVYTESAIWSHNQSGKGHQLPFQNCDKVLKHFGIEHLKYKLFVHDGPIAIYYFDDSMKEKYIYCWDTVTHYGYTNKFFREGHQSRPNVAYTFALSGAGLKYHKRGLFRVNHDKSIYY